MSEFEGQVPSFQRKLEIFDKKSNANKFWRIYVYGDYMVRHWGRHDTKGQQSTHKFSGSWWAESEAQDAADKKIRKGYKKEAGVLERMVRSFDDEDLETEQ